jgi:hypothetical protein
MYMTYQMNGVEYESFSFDQIIFFFMATIAPSSEWSPTRLKLEVVLSIATVELLIGGPRSEGRLSV